MIRYLYIICIKLQILFFKSFVFVCLDQILDRLDKGNLLQTIELIALNSHIINNI